MKKYQKVVILLGLFVTIPVSAHATGGQNSNNLWETLMGFNKQSNGFQQTAAVVSSVRPAGAIGTTTQVPMDVAFVPPAAPVQIGCDQKLLPFGMTDQTIRCDGINWVADSFLKNSGNIVHVGNDWSSTFDTKLEVIATDPVNDFAIYGYNRNPYQGVGGAAIKGVSGSGTGIFGDSETGTGVVGKSTYGVGVRAISLGNNAIYVTTGTGRAVSAEVGSGYGFYQEGSNAKNYFQGQVGIGTDIFNSESAQLTSDTFGGDAIRGESQTGYGVIGTSQTNTGVYGVSDTNIGVYGIGFGAGSIGVTGENSQPTGFAIKARQTSSGYGLYQEGATAKNTFEGNLGLGVSNPTARLEINGSIKFSDSGGIPPCNEARRGTLLFVQVGPYASGGDMMRVCIKNAGTYSWINLF